jgi:hypothetical protein
LSTALPFSSHPSIFAKGFVDVLFAPYCILLQTNQVKIFFARSRLDFHARMHASLGGGGGGGGLRRGSAGGVCLAACLTSGVEAFTAHLHGTHFLWGDLHGTVSLLAMSSEIRRVAAAVSAKVMVCQMRAIRTCV